MKYECNLSWGTWTAYFGKKYLPQYRLDVRVSAHAGQILDTQRIVYAQDDWGPFVKSRKMVPFGKTAFESEIFNSFDGIRVTCEGDENTELLLETQLGCLCIKPSTLQAQGLVTQALGEHYAMLVLYAESDAPWYLAAFPQEQIITGRQLVGGEPRDWFGVQGKALLPGQSCQCTTALPIQAADEGNCGFLRMRIRFLLSGAAGEEVAVRDIAQLTLQINGVQVWTNTKFSSFHDVDSQFLDEVFADIPRHLLVNSGNKIVLQNHSEQNSVLIQLVGFAAVTHQHMEILACPSWCKAGHIFAVTVYAAQAALLRVQYDKTMLREGFAAEDRNPMKTAVAGLNLIGANECNLRTLQPGENTFYFTAKRAGMNVRIRFEDMWHGCESVAMLPEIWDAEEDGSKIGVEVQTGTPQEYKKRICEIRDKQLGNLVVFRDYHNNCEQPDALWQAADFCRMNGLFTDAVILNDQAVIAAASEKSCLCVGTHEHTGIFYGRDKAENLSLTLRDAETVAVAKLAAVAALFRVPGVPVAVGDASCGSRYAYKAGFDVIRHETFVGHHLLVLPNARGAARAFHKQLWGVHVASQHNMQPELDFGIRRFWLGMYLPWVMGAEFVFEEDALFVSWQYNKMVGDDYICAHKRRITAQLYKYAATHPRRGAPLVDFAVMQGRHAPPVSGISVANNGGMGKFVNENYPVWGHTGRECTQWGWGQCEKGLHLLEVFSPGIYLNPLHQIPEKVRKFFGGNPRGEFDFLPMEADTQTMARYKLLLFLDWHTMENFACDGATQTDYEKLMEYAQEGGTVFLSIPHLTTRADRNFLHDMDDLQLFQEGNVAALCGVKVLGKSKTEFSSARFVGEWQNTDACPQESLRLPNNNPTEDGPCYLAEISAAGAVPVAVDSATQKPLLMCHRIGKGRVYLLCTYAYPGHEALAQWMPCVVRALAEQTRRTELIPQMPSADVYYSVWAENETPRTLYVLNTDWVDQGNAKQATFLYHGRPLALSAIEGSVTQVSLYGGCSFMLDQRDASVQTSQANETAGRYSFMIRAAVATTVHYTLVPGACLFANGQRIASAENEMRQGTLTVQPCLDAPLCLRLAI